MKKLRKSILIVGLLLSSNSFAIRGNGEVGSASLSPSEQIANILKKCQVGSSKVSDLCLNNHFKIVLEPTQKLYKTILNYEQLSKNNNDEVAVAVTENLRSGYDLNRDYCREEKLKSEKQKNFKDVAFESANGAYLACSLESKLIFISDAKYFVEENIGNNKDKFLINAIRESLEEI